MLNKVLPASVIGALSLTLHTLNTLMVFVPFLPLALLKFLIPIPLWRTLMDRLLNGIAELWTHVNNMIGHMTKPIKIDLEGDIEFTRKDWYLVIANHTSWADIFILQEVLIGKIPFLKFFLKEQLKWFPVLGVCWWALDFPFMKRYSKSQIKKKPELKGKDIETTKKACAKFKHKPISIMNFVEGTRFTEQKHARQRSPFQFLLKPKSGGIGYVMTIMGKQMHKFVDITIIYPDRNQCTFWDYLCGRVNYIKVIVKQMPVTDNLVGNYIEDYHYRAEFQQWLNQLWRDKDQRIAENLITTESSSTSPESVKETSTKE